MVERGVAKKSRGKLRLTEGGKACLERLRKRAGKRKLKFVKASKTTHKQRKVLFVCPLGKDVSKMGMVAFSGYMQTRPVAANLYLEHIGWQKSIEDFKEAVLNADFLVPMGPHVKETIQRIMGETEKPLPILKTSFLNLWQVRNGQNYAGIRQQIKTALEKEEKEK